jgi:hypothetical protein
MKTLDRSELLQMIDRLSAAIHSCSIDSRTMYQVHAYLVQSSSPSSVRAASLLDLYDSAEHNDDKKLAMMVATRMVGLLEGLYRSSDDSEGNDVLQIVYEPTPETPVFVLNNDERKTVLKLASEMRACVVSSDFFDHAHKARLFKRITAIEVEVHKPKGMFDVILGGINDIGEAFGKFGKDVKPLVERMEEIKKITRSSSAEYDQLPPPDEVKQLPRPDDGKNEQ